MLDANRRLRDVLREKGCPVTYREFAGGHDWVWLADHFAQGIVHLLAGASGAHQHEPVRTEGNS
jgi:enterochelin esterase family protein